MSQTKARSLIEAWVNIFIGFAVNFSANILILPALGIPVTVAQAGWIGVLYTLISLIRSYCIRRAFVRRGD